MLVNTLSRYWWMLLLRGVAWVLFGLAVMFQPGISLVTLTLMFGVFALIDGVGHIVSAIGGRQDSRSWWTLRPSAKSGWGPRRRAGLHQPRHHGPRPALLHRCMGDRDGASRAGRSHSPATGRLRTSSGSAWQVSRR